MMNCLTIKDRIFHDFPSSFSFRRGNNDFCGTNHPKVEKREKLSQAFTKGIFSFTAPDYTLEI